MTVCLLHSMASSFFFSFLNIFYSPFFFFSFLNPPLRQIQCYVIWPQVVQFEVILMQLINKILKSSYWLTNLKQCAQVSFNHVMPLAVVKKENKKNEHLKQNL